VLSVSEQPVQLVGVEVTLKYPDLDTNALFDKFLDAEKPERDEIAEDLYERGKHLCMTIHRREFGRRPIDLAEDAYHVVWVEVLRKGRKGGSFVGLMCKTFRRRMIDRIRRNGREKNYTSLCREDEEEEAFWERVSERREMPANFEAREQLDHTLDCIKRLPERQRKVMELRRKGLSRKQIAMQVRGSIKDLILHARQNLQKCLRERHGWKDEDCARLFPRRRADIKEENRKE